MLLVPQKCLQQVVALQNCDRTLFARQTGTWWHTVSLSSPSFCRAVVIKTTAECRGVWFAQEPKQPLADEPKQPLADEPKEPLANEPKEPLANEPKEPLANEPKEPLANEPKEPVADEPKEPEVPKEVTSPGATVVTPEVTEPTEPAEPTEPTPALANEVAQPVTPAAPRLTLAWAYHAFETSMQKCWIGRLFERKDVVPLKASRLPAEWSGAT